MSEYLYVRYSSKESNSITATIKFSEEEIMSNANKITAMRIAGAVIVLAIYAIALKLRA